MQAGEQACLKSINRAILAGYGISATPVMQWHSYCFSGNNIEDSLNDASENIIRKKGDQYVS
jgi:hypothetical protein